MMNVNDNKHPDWIQAKNLEGNMASIREYLEKMPTEQLKALLFQESFGGAQMPLASIYLTCEILACREPHRGTAKDIFLDFASRYADKRGASWK